MSGVRSQSATFSADNVRLLSQNSPRQQRPRDEYVARAEELRKQFNDDNRKFSQPPPPHHLASSSAGDHSNVNSPKHTRPRLYQQHQQEIVRGSNDLGSGERHYSLESSLQTQNLQRQHRDQLQQQTPEPHHQQYHVGGNSSVDGLGQSPGQGRQRSATASSSLARPLRVLAGERGSSSDRAGKDDQRVLSSVTGEGGGLDTVVRNVDSGNPTRYRTDLLPMERERPSPYGSTEATRDRNTSRNNAANNGESDDRSRDNYTTNQQQHVDFDEAANAYRKKPYLEVDEKRRFGGERERGGGEVLRTGTSEFWHSEDEDGTGRLSRQGSARRSAKARSPPQPPMSTWFRWVSDRRAAYESRIQSLEERQRQLEQNRVPTPVKKARLESQALTQVDGAKVKGRDVDGRGSVVMGTESALISDLREIRAADGGKGTKSKKKKKKKQIINMEPVKLTPGQWRLLYAFWNHRIFVTLRYTAIVLSVISMALNAASVGTDNWVNYKGTLTGNAGLWHNCTSPSNLPYLPESTSCAPPELMYDSQNVVIGLLLFSLAFGLLATILACCGVLSGALAKKLYYFHSAGEIFFICSPTISSFGFSYIIGWLAVACYLAAALCMCLDDLFRSCCSCRCCPGASPPPGAGLRRKPTIKTTPPPNNVDNN